jgi:hypothetical protein
MDKTTCFLSDVSTTFALQTMNKQIFCSARRRIRGVEHHLCSCSWSLCEAHDEVSLSYSS